MHDDMVVEMIMTTIISFPTGGQKHNTEYFVERLLSSPLTWD